MRYSFPGYVIAPKVMQKPQLVNISGEMEWRHCSLGAILFVRRLRRVARSNLFRRENGGRSVWVAHPALTC